jgi:hypothetical protein
MGAAAFLGATALFQTGAAQPAPGVAPGITDCDRLAQPPRSALGRAALVDGVAPTAIDVPRARAACEAAVAAHPQEPRFQAWLGQAGKTPHHTNAQKWEMMTDQNFQLAQNSSGGRFGKYTQGVEAFKDAYSDNPYANFARRELGEHPVPYTKWTSRDIVALYDNPITRGTFNWIYNIGLNARNGNIDAQNALVEIAPDSCKGRDWQCYRGIMNEAIAVIHARKKSSSNVQPSKYSFLTAGGVIGSMALPYQFSEVSNPAPDSSIGKTNALPLRTSGAGRRGICRRRARERRIRGRGLRSAEM